jgi:ribA/ribD-fused uncharacterized protein
MTQEKFKFFYGGPFSNWLACDFVVDGKRYFSAEQFMMAEKARMFGDKEAEEQIMQTRDPQKAKIIGRGVRGFKRALWDAKARDIVYKGCYAKFQQNKGLLHALQETKGCTLVEASPTDQIWGIGFGADAPEARDRSRWQGTNWLGEVLTVVRDDLEQGIYRTSNFCWSGDAAVENDVKITNKRKEDLWIWDNDKIRRRAYDLKHLDKTLKEVEVVVEDKTGKNHADVYPEVTIYCRRENCTFAHSAASRDSVLTAFDSALEKTRKYIEHEPRGQLEQQPDGTAQG